MTGGIYLGANEKIYEVMQAGNEFEFIHKTNMKYKRRRHSQCWFGQYSIVISGGYRIA